MDWTHVRDAATPAIGYRCRATAAAVAAAHYNVSVVPVAAAVAGVVSQLEGKGSLSDLLAELKEPVESVERRIKIKVS